MFISIDSYLNEYILRDNLSYDKPHEVNIEIFISDNKDEMLISEKIDDDLRIDKTKIQGITISYDEH